MHSLRHLSTSNIFYRIEFSRENLAFAWNTLQEITSPWILWKSRILYMEKSWETFLQEFSPLVYLHASRSQEQAHNASFGFRRKENRGRSRKIGRAVVTMADDKVDCHPTTDINTPLSIPLLIDRYGDRRTAGQLVDDRNVIICGAGMDATAPFHHYPPSSRPLHHLTLANPPSGLTIRAGC